LATSNPSPGADREGILYCQVCGAANPDEREYCGRCHHKLLVVSGAWNEDDEAAFTGDPEEQISFDEHLLERISVLEEVVRRTTDTVRQLLGTLTKLEQKLLVNQTGVATLCDLLDAARVINREAWSELMESRLDAQLEALEQHERLAAVRERLVARHRGPEPQAFADLIEEADQALLRFDLEEALRALEAAHAQDPGNYELAFFLGETYFNSGDRRRALTYFERVLEVKEDHYESLVLSGVLHHESGAAERSMSLLRTAVERFPDAFLPTFSLGAIYASAGRLREAQRLLERAVALEPLPQALFLLGSCAYEQGRTTTAIRHLEAAVRLDPSFEEALELLALAALERRWSRKALNALRRAQRLRPEKLRYHELAQLAGDGEPDSADAEAAGWLSRAREAVAAGEMHLALSCFRRALVNDPENATLLLVYAMACLELGRAEDVPPVIDKLIALEPDERLKATAYATLIEALRAEGKLEEGNRVGRLLLAEGHTDFSRTLAYYEMACNLTELEDLDQALAYARSALDAAPEELRRLPLAALGRLHYKRRELPQAVDCLSRASELAPTARTLTYLGMALLASGQRDRAQSVLTRAHQLERRRSPLQDKVGECLRQGARLVQHL